VQRLAAKNWKKFERIGRDLKKFEQVWRNLEKFKEKFEEIRLWKLRKEVKFANLKDLGPKLKIREERGRKRKRKGPEESATGGKEGGESAQDCDSFGLIPFHLVCFMAIRGDAAFGG